MRTRRQLLANVAIAASRVAFSHASRTRYAAGAAVAASVALAAA